MKENIFLPSWKKILGAAIIVIGEGVGRFGIALLYGKMLIAYQPDGVPFWIKYAPTILGLILYLFLAIALVFVFKPSKFDYKIVSLSFFVFVMVGLVLDSFLALLSRFALIGATVQNILLILATVFAAYAISAIICFLMHQFAEKPREN
jgi:hypothetical protein